MPTRKRRRDLAFSEEEAEPQTVQDGEHSSPQENHRVEKEQEVWDAIREAHYEAIEQLPLTLQRQLSLMRKLDEQSLALNARLFPTLQKYIQQRQKLEVAINTQADTFEGATPPINLVDCVDNPSHNGNLRINEGLTVNALSRDLSDNFSPRMTTSAFLSPELQKDPETTRELLSHVAFISEELLRASQEKVNLAQTNHDSVERHIRLLDQAIQEQIASLSLEKSRLTTGIAVHLPDVVVPEWPRKIHNAPLSDDELEMLNNSQGSFFAPEKKTSRRRGSQRGSKKKGKEKHSAGHDEQLKDSLPLTITLPATTQQDIIDVQLHEELYCYCNRVSFGEMIACDNESCEREWFHLGCVGLTEIPEGEWFCEDCRDDES